MTGSVGLSVFSDYNVCNRDEAVTGSHSQSNATVRFVDAGAGDLHLAASDTTAIGNGGDLAADLALSFTTDIDGDLRGSTWDIGADQH